jgi:hypothetical protein
MRKRIDSYILLDFLEGWRTRLKNEQIIAINGIWAAKVEQSIKDLSCIIDFVKTHTKTYTDDKKQPAEVNEQTIEAVRDYMLDDLKQYGASSVKYQWTKSTGEVVTLEASIQKSEQEDGHEETAGD